MALTLETARQLVDEVLTKSKELNLKPIAVAVLDDRGCLRAFAAQDGTSLLRGEVARGKAFGALALGLGSRAIFERAQKQPYFVDAVNTLAQGAIIPVPGGVLVRDGDRKILGAIGISGDSSDNDEACAIAAITAAGLDADAG